MPTLLRYLVAASPLLFLAAMMMADPRGLVRCLRDAGQGLDQFQRHLQGLPPARHFPPEPLSQRACLGMRLFGAMLAAATIGLLLAR